MLVRAAGSAPSQHAAHLRHSRLLLRSTGSLAAGQVKHAEQALLADLQRWSGCRGGARWQSAAQASRDQNAVRRPAGWLPGHAGRQGPGAASPAPGRPGSGTRRGRRRRWPRPSGRPPAASCPTPATSVGRRRERGPASAAGLGMRMGASGGGRQQLERQRLAACHPALAQANPTHQLVQLALVHQGQQLALVAAVCGCDQGGRWWGRALAAVAGSLGRRRRRRSGGARLAHCNPSAAAGLRTPGRAGSQAASSCGRRQQAGSSQAGSRLGLGSGEAQGQQAGQQQGVGTGHVEQGVQEARMEVNLRGSAATAAGLEAAMSHASPQHSRIGAIRELLEPLLSCPLLVSRCLALHCDRSEHESESAIGVGTAL